MCARCWGYIGKWKWPSCSPAGKTGNCVNDFLKLSGVLQPGTQTRSRGQEEGHLTWSGQPRRPPWTNTWGPGDVNKWGMGSGTARNRERRWGSQQEVSMRSLVWVEQSMSDDIARKGPWGGSSRQITEANSSASLEFVLCSRNHGNHWRMLGRRLTWLDSCVWRFLGEDWQNCVCIGKSESPCARLLSLFFIVNYHLRKEKYIVCVGMGHLWKDT